MPHRIVLDARRIADFGIGTYIRNLVRSLAKIDHSNDYTLVTPVPDVPEFSDLPPNFETAFYEGKKSGFVQFGYTMFLRKLPADLFHIPLNAVPLWMPKPYVVTIHDMSTLLFANHHSGYRSNLRHYYLRRGLLRADRIMAVSSATRRDVESVLGIPASRIRVVYNAPDPIFCQASAPALANPSRHESAYPPEIQRVLDRYHILFFCMSGGPIRRRTFRDWWKPSRCYGANCRIMPGSQTSVSSSSETRSRGTRPCAMR
jgi:glycosyltransferase involved in cell wall biosynthesis